MTIKSAAFIAVCAAGLAAGAAFAQTWAPPHEIAGASGTATAAQTAPESAVKPTAAAPAPEKPAATAEDKKSKTKDCSAQADAKGLHGKERKKFRDACKKA